MASQTLLSLVVRLQQVMSVAQGRAMLLDYARKSCGARLALLFRLEPERQKLVLLAHSGRHPHPSAFAPETTPVELSLDGLFASALQYKGFVDIPNISDNALCLPEERALAWPQGRVLLYALRQGQNQGVLVFCFSPSGSRVAPSSQAEEELLIATSLLSAYLNEEEDLQHVRQVSEKPAKLQRQTRRTTKPGRVKNEQGSEDNNDDEIVSEQSIRLLTALCELGLLTSPQIEPQELDQQILQLFCSLPFIPGGGLWRYSSEQETFLLQASTGNLGTMLEQVPADLASLVKMPYDLYNLEYEPTDNLIAEPENAAPFFIWRSLYYRDQLPGALGLVIEQTSDLSPEQNTLLEAACTIAALILLHTDQQRAEQQAMIVEERNRIAREMHDSVMQDVAHVTQKLDYIQRILEKQPQNVLGEIEQARSILHRSLRDLRNGISSLLPSSLEEMEFEKALKALIHEYSLTSPRLKISSEMDNLTLWPQALQATIYRFMQEALNNIRKHASASEVSIRIRQVAGLGVIQISDNGLGFSTEKIHDPSQKLASTPPHLGLLTMEERIRQAGGVLEIRSKPGEGTVLKARFSLSQSSAMLTEREREVLRLLVDGLTNRAISERLSISLETVKSHVHHIMQKMHVKDRTQAAVVATKQQWL